MRRPLTSSVSALSCRTWTAIRQCADRFCHRQFLTREEANHKLLARVETLLHSYLDNDNLAERGLPTVQCVANCLHLSPRHLNNLLRVATKQITQQRIHAQLIAKANQKLSTITLTVSETAHELGFEHMLSFSKLCKAKTNLSPLEFSASFS